MDDLIAVKSSADVFSWIAKFINFEKGLGGRDFKLDRMRALAELAGHPEHCAPAIHVAGSKGKGTVTGMIAAILEEEGFNVARYTSPDVNDKRERITQGGRFFEEDRYIEAGKELIRLEGKLRAAGGKYRLPFAGATGDGAPTFFELITLYFFLCARQGACNFLAVETGMGGRLDATNIVDPLVSVITLIEKEHTKYLGDTIAAIAGEKAGIIKPGRPLALAEQSPEALEVFQNRARFSESPLFYLPDMAHISGIHITKGGSFFTLHDRGGGFLPASLELFVPIPGEAQAYNAGLAALAAKTALPSLKETSIQRGLARFTLPARFEKIREDPEFIIDGAHTARSMELCVKTFVQLYGEGGILLFGCAAGKDTQGMAKIMGPHFSRIIITAPGTFRTSYPREVFDIFQKTGNKEKVLLIEDTARAIEKTLALGRGQGLPVLGAGSFYLAGEIRSRVKNTAPTLP
ncbi:MAG: tetrahydrofolate synthase [Treponema sp.]|jgi:dihydrofolate synthase/folylpolyglutamate synthase|nr:tetrahydrofolate synthase [Treponema sp.]